jgi:hypothetical protein
VGCTFSSGVFFVGFIDFFSWKTILVIYFFTWLLTLILHIAPFSFFLFVIEGDIVDILLLQLQLLTCWIGSLGVGTTSV